jgi:hypothetical protein
MTSLTSHKTPSPAMQRILEQGRKLVDETRGHLIFALDATMSRQSTWDTAAKVQAKMFEAVGASNLNVQLVYFRGLGECKASKWVMSSRDLMATMLTITCRSGETQIRKVLRHVAKEAAVQPVRATIFIGDAFEERRDEVAPLAAELGRLHAPVFAFHEGDDDEAAVAFREIADLSGGVYAPFDEGAVGRLTELMRAAALFATGAKALSEIKKLAALPAR